MQRGAGVVLERHQLIPFRQRNARHGGVSILLCGGTGGGAVGMFPRAAVRQGPLPTLQHLVLRPVRLPGELLRGFLCTFL